MSWIKQANKIGKYEGSRSGFRIYCTKEPKREESFFMRGNEQWRQTNFIPGEFKAIDKTGNELKANSIVEMWSKIEIEMMRRFYVKRGY